MPAEESSRFPNPLYSRYVLQPFYRDALVYYYEPMLAANRAHVIMLYTQGIITLQNAQALLQAIDTIHTQGLDESDYQPGLEDLFFVIEGRLIQLAGLEFGGNLQIARSRNDLGYALTRLAIRPKLLEIYWHMLETRSIMLDFARRHTRTIMPGYTHTQPAQPTTLAHYMAGVLSFLERDTARLRFAYQTNNQSPLGAAALTGTGFPVDRHLSARLLGFESVMESTYDSIGASDNLIDVAAALTSLGVNLSRFTKDMLFWATQESSAIRIDDSFIQISSIMPQKRNPVVLEHLRARLSRLLGYAHTIVIQCHNIPYGDTQDIEDELLPPLFGGLETAVEILHLYGAVIQTLQVNVEHLRHRAASGFSTVTELADTLVREADLPFRQAHHIVSVLVGFALQQGLEPADLTSDQLAKVSSDVLGKPIYLPPEIFRRALDSAAFVEARTTQGGAAPSATQAVLDALSAQQIQDREWWDSETSRLKAAEAELAQKAAEILSG